MIPGTYALFDPKTNSIRPLYQSKPWFKPEEMGERMPFWFTASNGAELQGFVTFPPKSQKQNLPAVLIAHGGPLGINDGWSLAGGWENMEAQFLASRGYATVQIEYRGSGGRGKNFEDSGKLQMGTGMMQDMLDGLNWNQQPRLHRKEPRLCLMALSWLEAIPRSSNRSMLPKARSASLWRLPGGVSDIRVQVRTKRHSSPSRGGRNFLREAWGMDDPKYVSANSAIDHVDKFNVPVLIIHGEDDQRVRLKMLEEMRDALQKASKPVEYMT